MPWFTNFLHTLLMISALCFQFVGTLQLNRNPTNYFCETEQVAFCTSNVVPGIDYSNDPMLALRNFSYFDTQISRLGGVNFNQIPINQSRCPFTSTARDGQHAHMIKAAPHYHPNRFDLPKVQQMDGANYATSEEAIKKATKTGPGWQTFSPYEVKQATFGRLRPEKFAEHTNQATYFYNSMRLVDSYVLRNEVKHADRSPCLFLTSALRRGSIWLKLLSSNWVTATSARPRSA